VRMPADPLFPTGDPIVRAAEREIAAVLARLEKATGALVDGLGLGIVDATVLEDDRQMLLMSVRIDLRRPAALHSWGTDAG
jgi:hypothetical protein